MRLKTGGIMIDWGKFNIDWSAFFFLRPEWLWGFVPLFIILLLVLLSNKEKSNWKKMIASHLRPYVFSSSNRLAIIYPLLILLLTSSLIIIAVAGPTWKRIEVPGAKSEAILYIALDMSRSMLATDVQPNRLERAKFKIKDLLDANPKARTGLMVFAGTAHSVISICDDYNLILHQIESLHPRIMPRAGSNYAFGFSLIDTTMRAIEAPSTLLLITDEMDEEKAGYVKSFVERTPHRIEIMAVSTPTGGKVPAWRRGQFFRTESGEFYISKRNDEVLTQLALHPKISITPLTLDRSDVEGIAERVSKALIFKKDNEISDKEWEDMGYTLVFPILLFILIWFRKGFMVQLAFLSFLLGCDQVKSWDDLWYTKDYQAQRLYADSLYESSADTYENLFNKGVAAYKSGDIESAIYFFSQDSTDAKSQYNLGLSFAKLGYFDEALESFQLAQELDPHQKISVQNIKRTKELMIKTDSLAKLTGEPKKKLPFTNKKDEPLKERKAKGKDEELTSDTEVEELPESGNRVTDTQETGIRKAEELTEVPDDLGELKGDEVQDILLREISSDPSEFMKRKFEYQYKKYYQDKYVHGENW